jgi:chitinase
MKKIVGYVSTRDLSGMSERDIRDLDVINIAFAKIKHGYAVWDEKDSKEALKTIRSVNPGIKILLSIGGWGADGFSQAAMNLEGREKLADSAAELMIKYGLDGIDIDWEYPGSSLAGIQSHSEDKKNFSLLLKALREKLNTLGTGRMLTIAAGGDTYFTMLTDLKEISGYVDYVQLMTYDLQGGFQKVTGHHAALYHGRRNLIDACMDKAVRIFKEAGLPEEKMVAGVPFYSRKWSSVKGGGDGLGQEAKTTGCYGPGYGQLTKHYVNKKGYCRYWDEEAMAPYLFNGSTFISYEDQESLSEKIAYIKEKGLGGIMFWEYNCDSTGTLIPFIRQEIDKKIEGKQDR